MDDLDRQICELAHHLDEVQFKAFLATIEALAAGLDNVVASAGYPPDPVYVPENNKSSR